MNSEWRKPLVNAKRAGLAPVGATVALISAAPLGLAPPSVGHEWLTPLAIDFRPRWGRRRRVIVPFTVKEILEEQLARKLA